MVHTLPDITGAGATVALATSGTARWVQIVVSGTGTVRVGDSTVTASRGLPVPTGAGQFFPWCGDFSLYSLQAISVYVPIGATVSVAYEY